MPTELGSLLNNRYRIISELARGGMGAVYKGTDENLGVDVAIKVNLIDNPEYEKQFKREAKLLASLRHPNLPRVTDHFTIPGEGQYLVMDFIEGDDVKSIIRKSAQPLTADLVVRWVREILDALTYLHGQPQPIIHRDIKPANIKIGLDGHPVLVDFGLAKVYDVKQSTTAGAKGLTPGYAPPEQYGMGRTDPRTDLYSVGATLYELLTKRIPVDGLERLVNNTPLEPISKFNSNAPIALIRAIEKALEVRIEDRYQSAAEFSAVLAEALRGWKPPAPLPEQSEQRTLKPVSREAATIQAGQTRVQKRSRWPMLLLAVVMLAGVAGLAVLGAGWIGWSTFYQASPTVVVANISQSATPILMEVTRSATVTPTTRRPVVTNTGPGPTSTPVPLIATAPISTPRGSGSGQIAFVSERDNGLPQIFLMNGDGTDPQQLTKIADGACQPAWSPDGNQLVFISPCKGSADQYQDAQLYLMNVDGSDVHKAVSSSELIGAFDPDWSNAGVAFTRLSARPQVWVLDPRQGTAKLIGSELARNQQPSWSPDGSKLAYLNTSFPEAPVILWMNKDGTFEGANPSQLTREVRKVSRPAWSPDGGQVAYVVENDIWMVLWDSKGFNPLRLTSNEQNADPDYAPDSQWIVFTSWRDNGDYEIYLMKADGSLQTRLTTNPGRDYQPAWRP